MGHKNNILSIFTFVILLVSSVSAPLAFATHTSAPVSATSGDGIIPVLYENPGGGGAPSAANDYKGNPKCDDLGYDNELKMEPPANGVVNDGVLFLTITSFSSSSFSWGTNFPIPAIIAKGSDAAHVYIYNPLDNGDTGLTFPAGSSHISACYDDENVPPADLCLNVDCSGAGNECNTASCDPATGLCTILTPVVAGAACGDPSDTTCDNPNTCDGSGSCQANNEPTTTSCRVSAGSCDVGEFCDGVGNCPADGFADPSTVCRASAGICDVGENCTGGSAACPADGFLDNTNVCRTSAGACDLADNCPGNSAACSPDALNPSGTECRASINECDPREVCTGNDVTCPDDGHAPPGQVCSAGVCNTDPACVVNAVKYYTHTNVALGPILDNNGTPLDPSDDFMRPRTTAEANFGTPLSLDIDGNNVLIATLKNGKIQNYNPGQYYAVTKVTLGSAAADVSILEDFSDCTSGTPDMSIVNPKKQPPGSALWIIVSNGIVYDVSGEMAALGDLYMAANFNSAFGERANIDPNAMVLMYVKFSPGLVGTTYPNVPPTCHNTETVRVTIGSSTTEGMPAADLILTPKFP